VVVPQFWCGVAADVTRLIPAMIRESGQIGLDAAHKPAKPRAYATASGVVAVAFSACAVLLFVAPTAAQTPNRPLTEQDRRAGEMQAELIRLRQERDALNRDLQTTAREIQAAETRLSAIDQRKGELEAQETLIRGSLEVRYGELAKLLASMQRMGRNPPPVMITRREDILGMVRSAKLLGQAYPEVQQKAAELSGQLKDLADVRTKAEAESAKERGETQRLAEKRVQITALIDQRRRAEADKQGEFSRLQRAAADIAKTAEKIDDLAAATDRLDKGVADKTRLGEYEKALTQPGAAASANPPAGVPPVAPAVPTDVATPPAAQAPIKQAALTPPKPAEARPPPVTLDVGAQAPRAQAPIEPRMAFHLAKGKLPMPASGRRVISFGERTSRGPALGISIETRHGAQVTSPTDGWVVYAGEFRTYGQVLIINAGGGHHILLANLSQLDVATGQFLLAGEPVGTMVPAPRNAAGRIQNGGPVLYVEFRKDQKPVDPDPWWMDPPKRNADAEDVRRNPPQFSRG
jgi:murein hydrolase activator